jgi:hypothetical protein
LDWIRRYEVRPLVSCRVYSGTDVSDRFTELVQQDHENEKDEARAKEEMDLGEEGVEKGFSGTCLFQLFVPVH